MSNGTVKVLVYSALALGATSLGFIAGKNYDSDANYTQEVTRAKQGVANNIFANRPTSVNWKAYGLRFEGGYLDVHRKNGKLTNLFGNKSNPETIYKEKNPYDDIQDANYWESPTTLQFNEESRIIPDKSTPNYSIVTDATVTDKNDYSIKTSRGEIVRFPHDIKTKLILNYRKGFGSKYEFACNAYLQLNESRDCVPYITLDKMVVEPAIGGENE